MNKPEVEYLSATVFTHNGDGNSDLYACSWKCMFKALRKAESDYFISLPFLHFDNKAQKGIRAKDFFALLKP